MAGPFEVTDARLGLATRSLSLAALLGLALALSNPVALQVTLVMLVLGAFGVYVGHVSPMPTPWAIAMEATFGSAVVVLTLPDSVLTLPYLVVLPLLAGASHGIFGSALIITSELTSVIVLTLASGGSQLLQSRTELLAPWSLTIIGAGLLGTWSKRTESRRQNDDEHLYASTRRLLGQLRGMTRRLSSGLDPHEIALSILTEANSAVPGRAWSVLVMTDGALFIPIAEMGVGRADEHDCTDPILFKCWSTRRPVIHVAPGVEDNKYAVPIRAGEIMVGIVISSGATNGVSSDIPIVQAIGDKSALRLDAALVFDEIKVAVTADERQRLAREIHDGVAQELASLGYTIDEIGYSTDDASTVAMLKELRAELSRVVTELRLSIFDLRSQVSRTMGLGAAISDYLQTVGSKSPMTIHLTLNEAPTRLSPGVEAELLRITQEAITNARKHARAKNLWVDCKVRPPYGRIDVRDDGQGLQKGREDSYGIHIMRERAERIGATLDVGSAENKNGRRGTRVTVTVH